MVHGGPQPRQRVQVPGGGVALVVGEAVVLGHVPGRRETDHDRVPLDLGQHTRGGHRRAPHVRLDHRPDREDLVVPGTQQAHPVRLGEPVVVAVQQDQRGYQPRSRGAVERAPRSKAEPGHDPVLVDLGRRGMAHAVCRRPAPQPGHEALAGGGRQELGVPHAGRRGADLLVDQDDPDAHGPGERAPAHLVHRGDHPAPLGKLAQQRAFQPQRRPGRRRSRRDPTGRVGERSGAGAGHLGSGTEAKTSLG